MSDLLKNYVRHLSITHIGFDNTVNNGVVKCKKRTSFFYSAPLIALRTHQKKKKKNNLELAKDRPAQC